MFTDAQTRDSREAICNTCESKSGVRCSECGCFLIFLRKVSYAECPQKKW